MMSTVADPTVDPALPSLPPAKPQIWPLWLMLFLAALVAPCLTGTGIALVSGATTAGADAAAKMMAVFQTPDVAAELLWSSAIWWLVFAGLGARIDSRDVVGRLRLGSTGNTLLTTASVLLGLLSLGQMLTSAANLIGATPGTTLKLLGKMMNNVDVTGPGLAVLLGLGVTGAAEEVFFRGYLQPRLVARWGRLGIAVTAVIFGLIHFDQLHSPVAFGL